MRADIAITHEHVNTHGNPPTDVHYLVKVRSLSSNAYRLVHVLDQWTRTDGFPAWTLEEVEHALNLRVTGPRNSPLAPVMAFYAGCMVRATSDNDQRLMMKAWSKARTMLRAVNVSRALVKARNPRGDAWELRVDFRAVEGSRVKRAWRLYHVLTPLHVDLDSFTEKLRRLFQSVLDADWPGRLIESKWNFLGD